jgi:SNF2 family DNA or RNA helicase
MFKTIPFKHQLEELEATKDLKSWALFWEMGTGKSKVIIDTAAHLYREGKINSLVVIAPNGVAQNWEKKEIPTHLPDDISRLVICFNPRRVKAAIYERELNTLFTTEGLMIFLITYDGFMTYVGTDITKELLEKKKVLLVLDESHRIKSSRAKRTKRILSYSKYATYRRILTGTPVTIAPWDTWPQIKFLDPEFWKRNGFGSPYAFQTHFGVWSEGWTAAGTRKYQKVEGFKNLEQLAEILKGISTRITKEEVLELPERAFTQRFVEMSAAQRRVYNQLKDEFFAELDDGPEIISAPFAMTRLIRFQQILCGYLAENGEVVYTFKENPRLDILHDMLKNDIKGQVIIWSRFTHTIDQLMERLGNDAVRYDGQVDGRDRQRAVDRFQGGEAQFFVGNQAAGGTGLTLTAATTMVYYSNSFTPESRWQSLDRNHRIGQDKKTTVIDLVGGPIDQHLVDTLNRNEKMAATICRDKLKEIV